MDLRPVRHRQLRQCRDLRELRRVMAALKLYDLPDVAEILGVSLTTVYRLIAHGDLESCDVAPSGSPQSKTRVSADAIERFVKARTRKTPSLRTA
jgi:excisionase family DNA binding protein